MIKWPVPALWVDTATCPNEIRYAPDVYCKDNPYHTEAQLKQAVRDALKRAAELARTKMSGLGAEAAIRALIEEIEA